MKIQVIYNINGWQSHEKTHTKAEKNVFLTSASRQTTHIRAAVDDQFNDFSTSFSRTSKVFDLFSLGI